MKSLSKSDKKLNSLKILIFKLQLLQLLNTIFYRGDILIEKPVTNLLFRFQNMHYSR